VADEAGVGLLDGPWRRKAARYRFCGFDWPCRVQPDLSFFAVGLPKARVEHDGS
jgi:hypothetical protein